MNATEKHLLEVEKRFKKIANITEDIATYPIKGRSISNVETDKTKSKNYGEVFTPLWLVDAMIKQSKIANVNVRTLDLCAGYGQFSVRLMRYFYQTFPDTFTYNSFIDAHAFSEMQLSSCYKLLWTFGHGITLFIGDSTHLNKLPTDAKGIWCYIEEFGYWVCLTKTIKRIMMPDGSRGRTISEEKFVSQLETVITSINQTHTKFKAMFQPTLEAVKSSSNLRIAFLREVNDSTKHQCLQNVITPSSVCDDMLSCVDDIEKKSILVLYTCELVEYLIHKKGVDPKNIIYAADFGAALKSQTMQKMYGVEVMTIPNDPSCLRASFKGKSFDLALTNPPYNDHLHLKILMALMGNGSTMPSVAKEYVVVHPANWLIDTKGSFGTWNDFKQLVSNNSKSFNMFNGNSVFEIPGMFYPCVVSHFDFRKTYDKITAALFGKKFSVSSIYDITGFGADYLPLVKPLTKSVSQFIARHGSVWDHNVKMIDNKKYHCQLAVIRGHVSKDRSKMIDDDFYTLIVKDDPDFNKGVRKLMSSRPGPTFEFDTENERDNFIEYLKTDFARMCLAPLKITGNIAYGEMALIPWLDFTQSWDDEKLFKHFNIDQQTQNYIRSFLPDYYGIRKASNAQQRTVQLQSTKLLQAV